MGSVYVIFSAEYASLFVFHHPKLGTVYFLFVCIAMFVVAFLCILYTRSGARFARPLLACVCISFVYLPHGRLLLVPLYSLSKLNTNGSKARYLNWFKLH